MDLVQRKQAEISELLKDALDLQAQVEEIVNMASKVSEKFEEIGQNTTQVFKKTGELVNSKATKKFAKKLLKNSKYKDFTKGGEQIIDSTAEMAGALIEGVGDLIGQGISSVGNWYAKRKERKHLEKLLPQKQELARAKKDSIIKLMPNIEKNITSIINFCNNGASTIMDFSDKQRIDHVSKSTMDLFEAFFILENTKQLCEYLLDEFEAWLKGEHYSQSELKQTSKIYFECVNDLIRWSRLPSSKVGLDFPNKLSVGGNLILSNEQITKYSYRKQEVKEMADNISQLRLLSSVLPFSSKARKFNKYFSDYLKSSEQFIAIFHRKRNRFIWISVAILSIVAMIILLIKFI